MEGRTERIFVWMLPSASSGGGSGSGDLSAVQASPGMKEAPNELSSTEKKALEDFRAANSEHFVSWVDKVNVSSIIELVENKF